jgi:hypothetical protein
MLRKAAISIFEMSSVGVDHACNKTLTRFDLWSFPAIFHSSRWVAANPLAFIDLPHFQS